nr:MAG TPA: Ribosome, eukaryotic, ribosomal, 80S, RNA.0A [Caudoviricetes sp.]
MIFQKASGIPDNAQLFSFRYVLYSERKILLKTNVRKWLHHKYFCDNMKSRNFERMFEKRDREVHRMNKKALKKELNELIDQLNEEQIKRLIQLIKGMIGKAA